MVKDYFPFEEVTERIEYINNYGVNIKSMYSDEGNIILSGIIQNVYTMIVSDIPMDYCKEKLNSGLSWISQYHTEVYENNVIVNIMWYLDAATELVGIENISII